MYKHRNVISSVKSRENSLSLVTNYETYPEVDGAVYSAGVYNLPMVRMKAKPSDKVLNVRGIGSSDRNVRTSGSLVDEDK